MGHGAVMGARYWDRPGTQPHLKRVGLPKFGGFEHGRICPDNLTLAGLRGSDTLVYVLSRGGKASRQHLIRRNFCVAFKRNGRPSHSRPCNVP